ncbi:Peroxisomal fatty acid beta-oxidation multifunctional protein [Platanthera guangdongensis]|uniref:Peroxisomal fatty acid beta-oxidation multifunctional protein n=1 Tax=Platanthera guangdongensis TaxID=2320717 RepID=A0ABR2MFC1_9ASPA
MISFTICMCKPYRVGGGGKFSGGFDINVFMEVHKTRDVSLLSDESIDLLVNTIEVARKPSVAAIRGLTLGGGLELTMSCHARISTPDDQFGLPELTLGVILDLELSKSIRAKEGKECGIVDAIVSPENLLMVARSWASEIANESKP